MCALFVWLLVCFVCLFVLLCFALLCFALFCCVLLSFACGVHLFVGVGVLRIPCYGGRLDFFCSACWQSVHLELAKTPAQAAAARHANTTIST